eukprot:3244960-Pleurochrysis_carterae.AAC.5
MESCSIDPVMIVPKCTQIRLQICITESQSVGARASDRGCKPVRHGVLRTVQQLEEGQQAAAAAAAVTARRLPPLECSVRHSAG